MCGAEECSVSDVTSYTHPCGYRQESECQNITVNVAEGMHLYRDRTAVWQVRLGAANRLMAQGRGMIKPTFWSSLSGLFWVLGS